MIIKNKAILVGITVTLVLLFGCAEPNPHPMDMSAAVQNASSSADHQALTAHYQEAAKDADAKVEEHKKLLEKYRAHSYLYGRQAQMLEEHCESLINQYEKIAEDNREMAKLHEQIGNGVK